MLNAEHLATVLTNVDTVFLPRQILNISTGKIKRIAPNQPIWVLNSASGMILYYQGQPAFTGQSASQLIDDRGFRFGDKAIQLAKNSRSGWIEMELNAQHYYTYCFTKTPMTVCSLVP